MSETKSAAMEAWGKLGCMVVLNLTIGLWAVRYATFSIVGHALPWGVSFLAAFFVGQPALPVAILCLILRAAGVHVPFWHHS